MRATKGSLPSPIGAGPATAAGDAPDAPDALWPAHPFDPPVKTGDDCFHEECGVFGVWGVPDAARFAALGLHALQHRGQEAAGIVSYDGKEFRAVRKVGYVRDNFTDPKTLDRLPGDCALGHNRYSTAGRKGETEIRDIQPLYAELSDGGLAIAHNGNLTNAERLRTELVDRGSIFQSSSDTECVIHLASRTFGGATLNDRVREALHKVEGAFAIVSLTKDGMMGVRDPLGLRPLVLGRLGDGWVLTSETCALDIVNAEFVREIEPGEMVLIDAKNPKAPPKSLRPFEPQTKRFCIFEFVYFSRPDSQIGGAGVYEARRRIGEELAKESPVEADIVCPVPDSGTPAAVGFSQISGLPFELGVIKNQYVGRTFIEPSQEIRNMGVRLKLNVNKALVKGKRVVLVDDSVVRGTTSMKIKEMIQDAGALEVHFRIASPPTAWPCFYGVDTPEREKLMAATRSEEEMRKALGVDSLRFISLDGLYRACGVPEGRDPAAPKFCDACFSGAYPTPLTDLARREADEMKRSA